MLQPGSLHGNWRYERRIGKGGFGAVTLWTNQSQKIVIKQCIMKLSSTSRERWEAEVALMNETHHENLVAGRPVPHEIVIAINAPEKLLGLEYCDSDLRKVLSNVHHCCGLQEKMVLGALQDISCGLDFLHRNTIMHRDLKPENILLKQKSNGTTFKIADLGYAKQMDAQSLCQSFVGTLQYLAPELYQGRYGYAADYWSFGTLMFECITGTRPFTLTDSAGQWPILIAKKSDSDIWGRFDELQKRVVFYRDITLPNHLCQPLIDKLEDFLRLVLRHSPDKRGNASLEPGGPAEWYLKVKVVLKTRIISLFDVRSCSELSYVVEKNSVATFLDVKNFVINKQKLNDMSVKDIIFVTKNGKAIDNSNTVESYFQNGNYKLHLYIFWKKRRSRRENSTSKAPDRLREFLGKEDLIKNISLLKEMMYQAYYFCFKANQDYTTLVSGLHALLHNMKELKTIGLEKMLKIASESAIKLKASIEMYQKSLELDKKYIQTEKCNAKQNEALFEWNTIDAELKLYLLELDSWKCGINVDNISEDIENFLNNATIKDEANGFHSLMVRSEEVLKKFKESIKEKKIEEQENMIPLVHECLTRWDSISFHDVLKKVMQCREKISQKTEELTRYVQKLTSRQEQIVKWQLERQKKMWKLFRNQTSPHEERNDFLSNFEQKLDRNMKEVSQRPIHELIDTFRKKLTRLQNSVSGRKSSPSRKSPRKWNTFDASSDRSPEQIRRVAESKRRPSAPIPIRQQHDIPLSNGFDGSPASIGRVSKLSPISSNEDLPGGRKDKRFEASNNIVGKEFFPRHFADSTNRNVSNGPSSWDGHKPKSLTSYEARQRTSSYENTKKTPFRIASPQQAHIESVVLEQPQMSQNKPLSTAMKRDRSDRRADQLMNALVRNPQPEKPAELHIVDHPITFQSEDHGSQSQRHGNQIQGHGNLPQSYGNQPQSHGKQIQGHYNQQCFDNLQGNIRHVSSSPASLSNFELVLSNNNSPLHPHQLYAQNYDQYMPPLNNARK